MLVQWDPHRTPILAEKAGTVRFEDIEEGETVRPRSRKPRAATGEAALVVIEHKGEKHPRITIEGDDGKILDFHYLPAKARIEVDEGQEIEAGHMLARQPREVAGTTDITGGLPRVTEIFEARKPKDPAVLAEISGSVELRSDKRRGKMTIIVRSESGMEGEHHVPQDQHLLVHTGDYVEAGDPLIDGPLIPHDILRIKGEEALHQLPADEVQNVYRAQGVKINDKHIEIILTQMLRKVRVEDPGDTELLPGEVVDKFRFREANEGVAKLGKINEPGGTDLHEGHMVTTRRAQGSQRRRRSRRQAARQGQQVPPRHRQDAAAGHHQGVAAERVFLSAASLPGDHQGAHRSGPGRQGRPARRPEGKRHPRPPDPGRHGLQTARLPAG